VAAAGEPAGPGEEPVTAAPVTGGPVVDGPVVDGPVADGPVVDGPVVDGAATAEPDAWDLATGDGRGEQVDDPDHRG
jgi:hypothetical protein